MADKDWRFLADGSQVFVDKYASRFVRQLKYRTIAFKFYEMSFKYSDTVAFWHEHYASPEDAVNAAKLWCFWHGEAEREPETQCTFRLADGLLRQPEPEIEKNGW